MDQRSLRVRMDGQSGAWYSNERAAMNRSGLVLAIVVAVVIGAGCSDDDPAPASADASPSGRQEADDDPTPSPSGEKDDPPVKGAQPVGADGNLPAGLYFTDSFVPQAVFKVGAGWDTRFHAADSLELRYRPEPRDEVIYFDGSRTDLKVDEALKEIKLLFGNSTGSRRDFAFGSVQPVNVGDTDGQSFVMKVDAPQSVTVVLGERSPYEVRPGDRLRVHALDANGATVLIFVEAPAESFDEFSALAEDVLKTVRFPSA